MNYNNSAGYRQAEDQFAPPLPTPSALEAAPVKNNDMSFDVYSGLYVSDIDVGESSSSDQNVRPIDEPKQSGHNQSQEVCMSLPQISFIIIGSGLVTISIVLVLVCQIGLFGADQQVTANKQFSSAVRPRRAHYEGQQGGICNYDRGALN